MADPRARFAMIMAGGAGTRLWPMSRRRRPKQLLPFIDGRSLLEIAAHRLDGVVPPDHRLICTGETYRDVIRRALPEFTDEQILGEPVGRDTVNAVGLTAAVLSARDPDAVFAVLTADHLIEPDAEFRRGLDLGFGLVEAEPHRFVTFAIAPTFAATSYGWVERGDPVPGVEGAFTARRFIEKPPKAEAETLLASGRCGWNSGMFVFHAGVFLETLARYEPAAHAGLTEIGAAWNTPDRVRTLERVYPNLPKISVDYAVMEPAAKDDAITICAVPIDVKWRDVGSWPSYGATLDADDQGNRSNTPLLTIDSRNVLAVSDDPEHLVATIGCDDLIVVRTADVTLVCRAKDAEKVKAMVDAVAEDRR
ncbi:MAG: mannose-1-phosphate guanylyltransferase [Phycisphaerales bacterium]|nr:NTP transferase domain-containing protein [Phycisphaerae bacterium]NNF43830.1 mannose-1-phosphate guanylyltransferase [Phycisphaerales bacterium]NNM26590.1 mannose-1-phosphate guanylyltransferase [Phycisphaerales bacterium]